MERGARILITNDYKCFFCGRTDNLECHHAISGTANRKLADKYGLMVWLCQHHHRNGKRSVHQDYAMNLEVKRYAQKYFEENIGTREEFTRIFGKNYIWEE